WFISMDGSGLNERSIAACDRVEWVPEWGRERMKNMFRDRPDWCISRQRAWGVPITVFYCDDCGETLCDPKIISHVADIFERESADAWYLREAKDLLPEGARCGCGSANLRKEMDVLDVWLDCGTQGIWAALPGRRLPRRRRSVPGLVQFVAGGGAGGEGRAAVPHGDHLRLGPEYRRRQDVENEGQRRRGGKGDETERGGDSAAVVFGAQLPRRHARLAGNPDARFGRLPQTAQHGALLSGQSRRL